MSSELHLMSEMLQATALMPDDAPMGLPGNFYTSAEFFEFEKSHFLRHGWHCLGRSDEIPQPGDFFTIDLLNEPLLVVRGNDSTIRVLSNVCRHRSMPVAEGSGNRKLFVCSYHAWSYGRDGALIRAPHMQNANFDQSKCGLPQIRCEVWRGFIYANLDSDAADLAPQLQKLDGLIDPYETENFRTVHAAEEIWNCNWKCLVENFMEGYHLSVVHPQTLRGYTPTELCSKGVSGDVFTSYHANYPNDIPSRGMGATGLSEKQRHRSSLFSIFPTQVASQSASLLVSLNLHPISVDRIRVRWIMSVYGDDLSDETIQQRIALWEEVNREDREKLERLQKTLSSVHAQAGPLAGDDFEGTIRDFHKYLARSMVTAYAPIANNPH
ncbi:MAG: aromatic ring-hydroxylating dioxygenase subunit alpha [Rhizobiaceae bacterium]